MERRDTPHDTTGDGGAGDDAEAEEREPDYRFTLANERTFLAWIRTSLGLVAVGVAVRQLLPPFVVPGARTALALAYIALALVIAVTSYPRWYQVQLAIRRGEPIPRSPVLPLVAVGVAIIALLSILLVIRG